MPRVAVVTDSCASLPEDLIQELRIHWIPYYIHREAEVLRDLVTVSRDDFYRWLPTAEKLPQTASPGPGDYLETYQQLAESHGFREIISIHMTSRGSGAFQAATAAKKLAGEILPDVKIEVIDTLNVAMSQGWMAVEAARAALLGKNLAEIVQLVQSMIPVTRMIQTADTLRYLYMGGRIGQAQRIVGSLLNIKPLIGMQDGVIVALGTARSRRSAYRRIVEMIEAAVGQGQIKIAYMHAAALDEAQKIKELVEERCRVTESLIAELSPALGVHSGPGTAGVAYFPVAAT